MVIRLARTVDVFGKLLVAVQFVAWLPLGQHERLQRRLPQDFAREPEPLYGAFAIIRVGPVVRVDQRGGLWV